jgi:RHS repeat-associated protein
MTYDPAYHVFPISVTTPIPDPIPSQNPDGLPHGSQTAFVSTKTYDTPVPGKPPFGLVVATTDANGQTTSISYVDPVTGVVDPLLRPRKVTAPNGHQTINEYGAGTDETTRWVKVKTQIDETNWSEAISRYDGLGRTYLTEDIGTSGTVFTETEYDSMGRVKRSTNPYKTGDAKQWTTPEYDDISRTKKVVSPDSNDVQISYGLSTIGVIGITKTIVDQAGRERTGITDAFGNVVRVYEGSEAQNLYADYVFDTLGNLRKTIQGEQSRYFMYDSLGRVLFAKQPEQDTNAAFTAIDSITGNSQWSAKYVYDDNGNITTTTDARNVSITGSYDRLNRLVHRNYSDDSTPDVSFFYDGIYLNADDVVQTATGSAKGKTTGVKSSVSGSNNVAFDAMGRLTASQQITGGQTYNFGYVYNLSGGLIEETYPSTRVVKHTLNADGELSQVQSRKNANHGFFTYAGSFSYNASGAVTKMQLGNGRWETADYDPARQQITKIGLGLTAEDQNLLKLEFKYTTTPTSTDNNGSMREQKITVPAVGSNPTFTATQTFAYDSLNRIQSTEEKIGGGTTWKQTFSIDRYGNRRFDAANTTTLGGCAASVCNPEINTSDNRLKKDQVGGGSVDYDYDANGALVKDFSGQRFVYDAENHQKEFFYASNQTSTPDVTYEYDGEGRRVKKIAGSEMTIFVYDAGGLLVAEYSTTVVPEAQANVSYLTTDHLGSPRIITDQNGAVISRKDFTAFGEAVTSSQRKDGADGNGYDSPTVRHDYTGYQKDIESGLEFAQARYYNAGLGRFTSPDPLTASATIKNPQTFNRYSYAQNSPYKFTDPLGLMSGAPNPDSGMYITSDPTLDSKLGRVWAHLFKKGRTPPPITQQNQPQHEGLHSTEDIVSPVHVHPQQQDPSVSNSDPQVAADNRGLTARFTDGEGIAETVKPPGKEYFYGGSNTHYRYPNGQIIAVHIRDESGKKQVNVYVPSGDEWVITYIGKTQNTVEARNKVTKEVMKFFHISGPRAQADVNRNMQTKNGAGWRLIGQTGGPGGQAVNGDGTIHACVKIFASSKGYDKYRQQYSTATGTGAVSRSVWGDLRQFLR